MGSRESDLSGLLVRSLKRWKYAAKKDKSKDMVVRNSTMYREIIGTTNGRNIKSKRMSREVRQVPFVESPSSVKEVL